MKTLIVLCSALFMIAGVREVSGQPPQVTGDTNLEDRNIKDRSVDLERVKRDEKKGGVRGQTETAPKSKFEQIKEDFEQIQLLQSDIVAVYTRSGKIDFPKISTNAEQINKRGKRLRDNLFPPPNEVQGEKRSDDSKGNNTSTQLPKDVKTLIIEMDNTMGAFTSNPMFTNPQVVNSDNNAKAKADLEKLIELSKALKDESAAAMGKKE